jgi:hypothetical protein
VTATIISPRIVPDHPGNLPGWSWALPGVSETAALTKYYLNVFIKEVFPLKMKRPDHGCSKKLEKYYYFDSRVNCIFFYAIKNINYSKIDIKRSLV